ncbi:MAG: FAD-dependent oxidoreductase [Luteolibacter sp.]
MNVITDQLETLAEVDVLVIGAGSSGCAAAIAARESGADRVMLVERAGFPGGISTQALDTFYGFFTPGDSPRKVAGGIGDKVVDTLDGVGAIFLRPNTYGAGTGVNYNPERLKWVWDKLLDEAGVEVLLHSQLVEVESEGGQPKSIIISGKHGFSRMIAKQFIDASGDADFCQLAGLPFETAGESSPVQTMTTTFRMANVDLDLYQKSGGKKLLMQKMAEAVENGSHPLPRKAGSVHAMNVEGCISTVAVRVAGFSGLHPADLTKAEQEGRRQAFIYEDFLRDCVPGFADSNIIGLSSSIGVRESRRVEGLYRLTREDCLTCGTFEDKVLICGAPIEDHRQSSGGEEETHWAYVPDGGVYEVPYRTLVPQGATNTWVTGRCFSATHDAHASCRSMAQTMAMGHAVGAAAALALKHGCEAPEVPIGELQQTLRAQGAVLEMPDKEAVLEADGWVANRSQEASS